MQVLKQLGVETGACRIGIPGVRAGCRRQHTDGDRDGHEQAGRMRETREPLRNGANSRPWCRVGAHDQRRSQTRHRERGRVVKSNDEGAEAGQNGDATNDTLCHDTDQQDQRHVPQIPALPPHPPHQNQHDDGNNADDDAHEPIRKLDGAMDAHLLRWHERLGRAQRPGGASEPGAREANSATRENDNHRGDEREPGKYDHRSADGDGATLKECVHYLCVPHCCIWGRAPGGSGDSQFKL